MKQSQTGGVALGRELLQVPLDFADPKQFQPGGIVEFLRGLPTWEPNSKPAPARLPP
jgi:hypothetical protein